VAGNVTDLSLVRTGLSYVPGLNNKPGHDVARTVGYIDASIWNEISSLTIL